MSCRVEATSGALAAPAVLPRAICMCCGQHAQASMISIFAAERAPLIRPARHYPAFHVGPFLLTSRLRGRTRKELRQRSPKIRERTEHQMPQRPSPKHGRLPARCVARWVAAGTYAESARMSASCALTRRVRGTVMHPTVGSPCQAGVYQSPPGGPGGRSPVLNCQAEGCRISGR